MSRDRGKSEIAQPCREWRALRRCGVRVEQFHSPVCAARQQLLILCPAHSLYNVRVRLALPHFVLTRQIPNFDNAIAASTCKSLQRLGVLRNCVHSVDMSSSQIGDKWLREHALELGGIQGARVFSRPLERVEGGIEIARRASDIAAGRLGRRCGSCKRLDFLLQLLVSASRPSKLCIHTMAIRSPCPGQMDFAGSPKSRRQVGLRVRGPLILHYQRQPKLLPHFRNPERGKV